MTAQAALWWTAGGALALAASAAAAEWLRGRRRNLDRVGWMPWQTIQVLAFFSAIALAGLAMTR
ncbi:hypothetical protein [Allosphingosinicella sp.]|jgi:hypothetical protein|uniref:hypothetical protein n=1 Tax=Allosphingosinicella sp. TaxID=2823234 RepID=UPI002EEB5D20